MGNFISLTPWSHLFQYYQHNKRKRVLKGVISHLWSEYNPSVAVAELGNIFVTG